MKQVIFWLLPLFLAAACKKNNGGNTIAGESFPNTVGDHWHYLVKDTTQSLQDTTSIQYYADVVIVGKVQFPNGINASIWQFNSQGLVDTNYVFQIGDTIRFTDRENDAYFLRQYIFPFSLASSWPYVIGFADVSVVGQGDVDAGGNNFQGAWEIRGSAGMPDGVFGVDEFFEDRIGFVRKYFNPYGELISTKHVLDWSLVSYELK